MTNLWANSRSMALVNNPGYLPLSGSMNASSSTEDRLPHDPDPIARERQAYVTASCSAAPRPIHPRPIARRIRAARALDGPRHRILQNVECGSKTPANIGIIGCSRSGDHDITRWNRGDHIDVRRESAYGAGDSKDRVEFACQQHRLRPGAGCPESRR